jgi:hypothetical protein
MNLCRLRSAGMVLVALGVAWTTGCQTYYIPTGQTLPSGYYLHHQPQYNPPTPPFPESREQANLEQAVNQASSGQVARPNQP